MAAAMVSADGPVSAQGWRYFRHELLYLCWAVMETALLAPLALAVMPWARLWPPSIFMLWLILVMLIPFNLSRLLTLLGTPVARQKRIVLVALIATFLFALRTLLTDATGPLDFTWVQALASHLTRPDHPFLAWDLAVFFLVGVVWWRGLGMTGRSVDVGNAALRLRAGGLIVAPVVIMAGMLSSTVTALPFLLLFFIAALTAVALSRAEQTANENEAANFPIGVRWLGIIVGTSTVIVLGAAAVATVVSGRGVAQLVEWLGPVRDAVYLMATVGGLTATYVAFLLATPLTWLLVRFAGVMEQLNISLPSVTPEPPDAGETDLERLLKMATESGTPYLVYLNLATTVLIVVVVTLLLYLALSRYFRQREMLGTSEELAAEESEASGMPGFGGRLWQRLAHLRHWRAATTIRRLYQKMCVSAAKFGYPRAVAQTPYEYLETLVELWPGGRREAALITEAYVRIRYGELPETEEELAELQKAWRKLEKEMPGLGAGQEAEEL